MSTLSRSFTLQLPEDWTPEQALAVYDLLNNLTEALWHLYEVSLPELLTPTPVHPEPIQPDLFDFDDPLSF